MIDIFLVALKAIMVNKVRSILTTLGVVIGVGSVVLLTSIGTGLSAYVTEQFDELGANTVYIFPGEVFGEGGGFSSQDAAASIINSKLTMNQVNSIRRLRNHVRLATPINIQTDRISFKNQSYFVTAVGATADVDQAMNISIEQGRMYTVADDASYRKVVILGYEVASELFGSVDPIGRKVRLSGQQFTVMGVASKRGGGFGGPSFDTMIYLPFNTFSRLYDTDTIVRIIVKTNDPTRVDASIRAIERLMAQSLDEEEFSVVDQSEILSAINQILGALTVGLGGISAISLVVGGIGIMNIMLVSVTERTREIGLRKALGATPNTILVQFLIEAAVLSLMGGVVGVIIAFIGTIAMQPFIPARITPEAVLLAFGVSTLVGLVFGAAPARRASQLSPIEALRYE